MQIAVTLHLFQYLVMYVFHFCNPNWFWKCYFYGFIFWTSIDFSLRNFSYLQKSHSLLFYSRNFMTFIFRIAIQLWFLLYSIRLESVSISSPIGIASYVPKIFKYCVGLQILFKMIKIVFDYCVVFVFAYKF